MNNIDLNLSTDDVANQIIEISANYTKEERLAFLQGMVTTFQLFELGVKSVVDDDDEVVDETLNAFADIENFITEVAKRL